MSRGTWCGLETLGPDEDLPEGHIPSDSRRHSGNRNDSASMAADRVLRELADRLVRKPDGRIVKLAGNIVAKPGDVIVGAPERTSTHDNWIGPDGRPMRMAASMRGTLRSKATWRYVGPCDVAVVARGLDDQIELFDERGMPTGETISRRQHLEAELDRKARELKPAPYRTGRRLNLISEGEGIIDEVRDDAAILSTHGQRLDDKPLLREKP